MEDYFESYLSALFWQQTRHIPYVWYFWEDEVEGALLIILFYFFKKDLFTVLFML